MWYHSPWSHSSSKHVEVGLLKAETKTKAKCQIWAKQKDEADDAPNLVKSPTAEGGKRWAFWVILRTGKRHPLLSTDPKKNYHLSPHFPWNFLLTEKWKKQKKGSHRRKRQDATLHKHFLLVVLTYNCKPPISCLSAELESHMPNTWELRNYCNAQCSPIFQGLHLRTEKNWEKSQDSALWFACMNLEVLWICTQTMEI